MTSLDNVAGLVMAGDTLDISASGKISNQGGALGAEHLLKVRAAALDNSKAGNLRSEGRLSAEVAGRLDNQDKGLIQATGVVEVQAGHLDNRKGRISAGDTLQVSGETADNRGGVMRADQALNLLSSELDNRDKGRLESQAAVTVEGRRLDNSGGLITSRGTLGVTVDGQLVNQFANLSSYAEKMLVSENTLVKIADDIPLDVAALNPKNKRG